MTLHSEILEQPARLESLLVSQRGNAETIARAIKSSEISYVFLTARGTSDNAGRYANYLFGAINQLPLALATPSLFTYYQQPPKLRGALVIGISQSGQSPDIISVLDEGKRQGCLTLAITNEPNSPLGKISDLVFPIEAGPERAVAATKTYTAELMAIAMLSAAMRDDKDMWEHLEQIPSRVDEALQHDEAVRQAAERYRYMQQCVVLGRGFNYATAFEWALKLKELTYVEAEPYSSADFQHGPIAMVARGFPVMAVISSGALANPMFSFLEHLRNELLAELVIISNSEQALNLGQARFPIAADVPESLSPLVNIIPAQLFSYHLTLAKGYDADHPRTIHKVTETR
ncbi:MAG TPA: SIS domain-containing protein [Anaerolineales bacterium]|nr:SIS domain-containing protein [Anaerolineales bacterium]